ncbi:putative defense protein 3 [Anopheles albimanus]|uniref:putative defense protein 3 n=1 Tax=Anopheles albimanus TaxID=7167 RepID=UPI0016411CAA|nr:putative defense protein 3 [Anopheles albimanus]
MANRATRFLCTLALLCIPPAFGYPTGAPGSSCIDMTPAHGDNVAQEFPSPYEINLSKQEIRAGETLTITVNGNTNEDVIKGLLCQVRVGETPVGSFDVPADDEHLKLLDCNNSKASAVTHRKATDASNVVSFNWIAPQGLKDQARVYCTIVKSFSVFWVKLPSELLTIY